MSNYTLSCIPVLCQRLKICYVIFFALILPCVYVTDTKAAVYTYRPSSGAPSGWVLLAKKGISSELYTVKNPVERRRDLVFEGSVKVDFRNPSVWPGAIGENRSLVHKKLNLLSWTFQTENALIFSFKVKTNNGYRTLVYSDATRRSPVKSGSVFSYALGQKSASGQWIQVTRDLVKDIRRMEPELNVLGVTAMEIHGKGRLRNIMIGLAEEPAPASTLANYDHQANTAQVERVGEETLTDSAATASTVSMNSDGLSESNTPALGHAVNTTSTMSTFSRGNAKWSLKPYVVAARNAYSKEGELESELNYAGLVGKYSMGERFFTMLEINPDFALIENQLDDINFSYNEKKKTDPRGFFREGPEYFGDESDYFYSLRVPDFDYGVKGFTHFGNSKAGALIAGSSDNRQDAHVRYALGMTDKNRMSIEAVTSDQRDIDHRLLGGTLKNTFRNDLFYVLRSAISQNTTQSEEKIGSVNSLELGWSPGPVTVSYTSDIYELDFNPTNALIEQDLPGTRGSSANISFYQPGKGFIENINGSYTFDQRETLAGKQQNQGMYISTDFELFKKARAKFSYSDFKYRPLGDELGVFLEQSNRDEYWAADVDFNINSTKYGYGFSVADGELAGGDYQYLSAYSWFSPINNLSFTLFTEKLTSFGDYLQNSVKADWRINNRQSLLAKFSNGEDYDLWRLAYSLKFTKDHEIYLAYKKLTETDDELVAKFSWTLR